MLHIQAQIEADEELAHRLQAQERERYSEADKAKLLLELINERKRQLAQQRSQQRSKRVTEEGMNVEALQTKYPIIDWEVYTKESRKYWKIIRVGDHTEIYQFFEDMLKNFDRDDLAKL
ncbi:hypothetical protein Tco_0421076 [Tanacetum coccineum]